MACGGWRGVATGLRTRLRGRSGTATLPGVAAGRNRERFVSFTQRILLSMLAGIVVGVALNWAGPVVPRLYELLVEGLFYVVGAAFVALLSRWDSR